MHDCTTLTWLVLDLGVLCLSLVTGMSVRDLWG